MRYAQFVVGYFLLTNKNHANRTNKFSQKSKQNWPAVAIKNDLAPESAPT